MNFSSKPNLQQGSVLRMGLIVLAVIIVLSLIYIWAALSWSYSTGERAGWLQKLSNKGVICKTNEGELSLIAVPGAAPEKFLFTVRDPEVVKKIQGMMGRRVSLHYEQKVGLPTSCFGETSYFITSVEEVSESSFPPWTSERSAPAAHAVPAIPAAPSAPK